MIEIRRISDPKPMFRPMQRMYVERGIKADWDLLHELHYKAVGTPAGSRYWRLVLDDETIGVLVSSSPKLLLKERHKAFPKIKPGRDSKTVNTYRAVWINKNIRVISRFVIDTMFRGIGIAYRFQNIASRMENVRFMEIQSSMSKYNLFAQRAGFRFVKPSNSLKYDVGMAFFASAYASNPADHEELLKELYDMPPGLRRRTIADTREFYYKHSALEKTGANRGKGTSRVDEMPVPELLKNLQQMVLASPMYGVYENPDLERDLPSRIPILTFDRQRPDEPLDL